jgi:hypothetical protein
MPWHDVQFLKMTFLTGPLGVSTCGRVGFSRNCPATGGTGTTAMTAITYNAETAEAAEKMLEVFLRVPR